MSKSFERWFAGQGREEAGAKSHAPILPDVDLPDGLYLRNRIVTADCRVCGKGYEFCGDLADGFDQDMSYCGGSPWCCP